MSEQPNSGMKKVMLDCSKCGKKHTGWGTTNGKARKAAKDLRKRCTGTRPGQS